MKKYQYPTRVRFSEVDEEGNMTPFALLNNLQDCATFHGEDSGIGFAHNKKSGHAWVIANMQLEVISFPFFDTEITTNTWTTSFRGPIGHRCFEVTGPDGQLLAAAHSDWVFMDMIRQLPEKVTDDQKAYGLYPELDIPIDPGKRKVRVEGDWEKKEPIVIREDYLDTNGHMNNAQYVRLAAIHLPEGKIMRRIRAEWKRQAMLNEKLIPCVLTKDEKIYVRFDSEDGGDPFFICEMTVE
ncbi:MAG: acyl-ACP thioesterase domain-containing protein [Eubacteriales bacterium]|jgi:acyl-ACP thioesterase